MKRQWPMRSMLPLQLLQLLQLLQPLQPGTGGIAAARCLVWHCTIETFLP
jgi:hypothetical protein